MAANKVMLLSGAGTDGSYLRYLLQSLGAGVSLPTHTALALSAESSWIRVFSDPSMNIQRYTQGGVESHRRIFLYNIKKIWSLSCTTWR